MIYSIKHKIRMRRAKKLKIHQMREIDPIVNNKVSLRFYRSLLISIIQFEK